ncbi:replication protein [Vibrio parahaemolyticus O1:Kuk str. FDA_R31]|uniref:replication endonuclease n=1 Tax=Vibrio parahaemolyticus TaxID=670 RepID=UPI0003591183|nr:replication endonuclease [Vibrio parahaemolyticus]AGQ91359.1 replication protein [Vibrio parahaemolyticus O1:Kuk str. FDA_R31]EJB0393458.1 replication endonuclease [Vibrio parahaemolyticus]EJG2012813.1 replication endonuclease [Vibrio parahaemolyticus]EJG2026553.1 replication endonuclease [Vibrio parahaemolyticus]ODW68699.1 replication protein [Vibrio parahaemolyticus]
MAEKITFTTEQKRAASIACQQWGHLHVYPQKPKTVEISAERPVFDREPEGMSVTERKLFEANPEDFEWARERIKDLPDYLTKYFVTRYISVFEKKSRREANIFLRERMGPAAERALMVLRKYKKLPTTQKVSLLSEEFSYTEQSDFANNKQAYFDFDKVERNRKPVKSRLLAELEPSEIKEMAFKISVIVDRFIRSESDKYHAKTELGTTMAVVFTYEQVAKFVTDTFGVKPPRKYKEQSELSALQDISKLISEKWWCDRLNKIRKIMREHLAIAMGQVSSKASPYASWDCVREHQEQQTANYEYIKQCQLLDEETGEEADLWDMVKKSVANPAIRRHELMVRCRGCEDIGNELGLQGLFLTLTTPAKYHNSYKKGGFIGHWNGASPRDAQTYLNNVWQRIRAKLGRKEIRWFGVRVAEPHHDGTPHWHLLIWVKPEDKEAVTEIFVDYATKEDKHELFDKQGKFDHSARCDVGEIDPEKGTATGYIAKYISKNIDGFAMDDEVSDETGKSVKDMAKNVSAWKSRWNIRQFQFFGGAPVTTYRELRRFANQNKKAFMEYLFMQERVDLLTIYSMLQRDLVGPIKPSKLITNEELMKVIGDSYQARTKSEDASITDTLKAADHGNWQGYIIGQGGPFVKREDLLIVNSYEVLPFASPHGEDVRKIEGFATPEETIKTRTKVWTIQKKSKVNDEAKACALGSEATALGASGSSRSSVNNCTEPEKVQVCDQLTRLLNPRQIKAKDSPTMDDAALAALLRGSSVRVDDTTSIQIRPAEVDEHGNKRSAQLVEVSRSPAEDRNWMEFESWDKVFAQPEQATDEYKQPDLSFFSEREDDWPM